MKRQLIYHTPIAVDNQHYVANEANVLSLQGQHESARIKTISRDGISLNCDQPTLRKLLPNTVSVSPKQPARLEVNFKLDTMLEVIGDVICIRRLSKDTFQLDLRFSDLDTQTETEIDNYVEKCLYSSHNDSAHRNQNLREFSQVA